MSDDEDLSNIHINEESNDTASGGLSDYLTTLLLSHFESSGDTREKFDLLGFCNSNTDIYGTSGSKLRRQVQLRWGKFKRRKIASHCDYLRQASITAGAQTQAEYKLKVPKKHKKTWGEKDSPSTTSTMVTSEEISVSDDSDGSGNESSHSSPNSIMSVAPPKASDKNSSISSAKKGPRPDDEDDGKPPFVISKGGKPRQTHRHSTSKVNSSIMFSSPPPSKDHRYTSSAANPSLSDVGRQHVFGNTSNLFGAFASLTEEAFVPVSWLLNQKGTNKNPWIVQVNILNPERNRDFDIQFVEGIDQDDLYSRCGFHIRRTVAAPDYMLWEASIPQDYEEQFAKRIVLVKGPARDFWQKNSKKYHMAGKVKCDATKKAHSASEIAIEKSDDRHWAYYLVCFPPEIILDNQIFSKDEELIPVGMNPMKCEAANNDFEKDIRAMVLYWRVAVKEGTKIGIEEMKEESKTLFSD